MQPPGALIEYRRWGLRIGGSGERVEREVAEARAQGNGFVARFAGVDDRSAAARLTGAVVDLPRSELPALGEREFYRSDLVGLAVSNLEGQALGVVDHFVDAPASAVMVVRGQREHWVPVTPQHVRRVDLAQRTVVVDWPETLE